jgi:hydroxyacylglutathione hydrolase
MYLSDEGGKEWQYEFEHEGLKNGNVFFVGNLEFEVIHTPGHTPESISFLLTDLPASDQPVMLFTGDFVFVGDIGRPDLLEKAAGIKGTQEAGAKQMFNSLKKFRALPDHIQVWPGHGAGSACGKALGAVPGSTIGYEKIRNWALQYEDDEKGFIKYLLEDQPEPPQYFATMKKLNRIERPLLTEVPRPKKLSARELATALSQGIKVIDTRPKADFAKGFIPGTINIQGNNAFATWMGWFVSYEEPFILIAAESKLEDLTRKLMRIGLDNIAGYIEDVDVYTDAGGVLQKSDVISMNEFKDILQANHTHIVDLRGAAEFKAGHIKGADNVFIGTLEKNLHRIEKDKPVVIHCQSGDRSAIGYSLLLKHGYKNIRNYSGGMSEWGSSGNEIVMD